MAQKGALKVYRARRKLSPTSKAEPYGRVKTKKTEQLLFVIQKHDASHLHYDFRLEVAGVLKSWAVPKGLPEKYGVRRLAIATDDHPYEYAHFEGIIPEGHYGGGTVMVWDIGTYENIKQHNGKPVSMEESYDMGSVEVVLHGKKISGAFALVRTKLAGDKENWIMLKMKMPLPKKKATKKVRKDVSAITGRTMNQIAKDRDAVWE